MYYSLRVAVKPIKFITPRQNLLIPLHVLSFTSLLKTLLVDKDAYEYTTRYHIVGNKCNNKLHFSKKKNV